jgi:hypothetical protein
MLLIIPPEGISTGVKHVAANATIVRIVSSDYEWNLGVISKTSSAPRVLVRWGAVVIIVILKRS